MLLNLDPRHKTTDTGAATPLKYSQVVHKVRALYVQPIFSIVSVEMLERPLKKTFHWHIIDVTVAREVSPSPRERDCSERFPYMGHDHTLHSKSSRQSVNVIDSFQFGGSHIPERFRTTLPVSMYVIGYP